MSQLKLCFSTLTSNIMKKAAKRKLDSCPLPTKKKKLQQTIVPIIQSQASGTGVFPYPEIHISC